MAHCSKPLVALLGSAAIAGGIVGGTYSAFAQQAPRQRATIVAPTTPAKIALSVRGADATPYLSVQAANSDVRDTLNALAEKAGIKLVLAQSATGVITGNVESQPVDQALASVAKLAGLSVRKIVVPDASAATVTADTAGRYADALSTLPIGALVADPATGKSLTVAASTPAKVPGTVVYFVPGKLSADQERMTRMRRNPQGGQPGGMGGPGGPGGTGGPGGMGQNQASTADQATVDRLAQSLQQLPLQQRMDTLRTLQRQMFQNMTPEERDQMRNQFGGRGGGFGGGRGGRGGGGQGGPGGNGGPGGGAPGEG